MAIWKESAGPKTDAPAGLSAGTTSTMSTIDEAPVPSFSNPVAPVRANGAAVKESLIAANLTIEGKIEGAGHVRMAGQFKGDVNVDGNLTIEAGAKVTGSVRAHTVIIAGELEGNIDAASHVELLETGVLNGDLRAGSFVVVRGSRMRGQVAFGWGDEATGVRSGSRATSAKMEVLTPA